MPNIKRIITSQNSAVTRKNKPQEAPKVVVYQATVIRQDNQKRRTYIGLTDNSFKTRYNRHTCSFRNETKQNTTTLSQHIWKLYEDSIPFSLKWKIIAKGKSYSTSSKTCNLCLKEKYYIICKPDMTSLNNRNELASECRHNVIHTDPDDGGSNPGGHCFRKQ